MTKSAGERLCLFFIGGQIITKNEAPFLDHVSAYDKAELFTIGIFSNCRCRGYGGEMILQNISRYVKT